KEGYDRYNALLWRRQFIDYSNREPTGFGDSLYKPRNVSFSHDGTLLAIANNDKTSPTLYVFNVNNNDITPTCNIKIQTPNIKLRRTRLRFIDNKTVILLSDCYLSDCYLSDCYIETFVVDEQDSIMTKI